MTVAFVILLGCASPPSPSVLHAPVDVPGAAPAGPVIVTTAAGRYTFTWAPQPAPLPFNTLFSIRTVLLDRTGMPVTRGSVSVDATMPQHGHGMPTHPIPNPGTCGNPADPATCVHPDGIYVSDGMKFHMQGEWVLHFVVDGPDGQDVADVHYAL